MRTWFTADLHLGHAAILHQAGRPFADLEAMESFLVRRWNSVVGVADTVWILGDAVVGDLDAGGALLRRLHGRKFLVPGNHDPCFPDAPEPAAAARRLVAGGGLEGVVGPVVALRVGAHAAVASHFPYTPSPRHHVDPFVRWRPIDDGATFLLHGHVHSQWRMRGRMVNVGLDAWGGRPVGEASLAALIAGGPADLRAERWEGRVLGDAPRR